MDNNNEEVSTLEDINVSDEEVNNNLEVEKEESQFKRTRRVKKPSFIAFLGANILDQCVCIIISMVIAFIITFVLPYMGYRVSNSAMMVLMIYIVVNIFYNTILEASKKGTTFGKRIIK